MSSKLDNQKDLQPLQQLFLAGCVGLEGGLEPLSGLRSLKILDLEACLGLEGTLEPLWALERLERLNVCDTPLQGAEEHSEQR